MFSTAIQRTTQYFQGFIDRKTIEIILYFVIMSINSYLALSGICYILDASIFIAKMLGKFVWNNLTPGQKLPELAVIIAIIGITINGISVIYGTKNKDSKRTLRLKNRITKLKTIIAEKDAEISRQKAEIAEKDQFISESTSLFDNIEELSNPI